MSGFGQPCEPGCTCRKHTSVHREDCMCRRCGKGKRRLTSIEQRKRSDRCKCGHVYSRHDAFGCKTCEERGTKMCTRFIAHTDPRQPRDNTFAREVKREGFIEHNRELATCTTCWGEVKIGFAHSVSCVINARAHAIKCKEHAESLALRSRPNRTSRVGS